MPISGIGAPQWVQGKVSSGAAASSSGLASPSHSVLEVLKEGGTSFPQLSKTSQHLRPDGDHSDKQGQRGQSSSFLDHSFEHDFVSRNRERT